MLRGRNRIRVTQAGQVGGGFGGQMGVYTPAASGPDLSAASAVVSGAGNATVNSTIPRSGSVNGKARYSDGTTENGIQWSGSEWRIIDGDLGAVAYTSNDDTTYPWEVTTWAATINGALPVPTVTHT